MKKVVVFDSGWGGELVADFLAEELQTVEIIRVIDWPHAPYGVKSQREICQLVVASLAPYIGRVDLIVLAGYTSSLATSHLRQLYPTQAFVEMSVDIPRVLHSRNFPRQICVFMNKLTTESDKCKELYLRLPDSFLTIPDCAGWDQMIDDGEMTPEFLRERLASYFHLYEKSKARSARRSLKPCRPLPGTYPVRADAVILMDTHFWDIRKELEGLFGWSVRIIDSRQKLLHDVCTALNLRGVDGNRMKYSTS